MSDEVRVDTTPFAGLDRLSRHLGYHARRQEVLAGNLANLDTPGYRAKDLVFHEELSAHIHNGEMRRTMRHSSESVTADDEVPDQDGNTVSLETQMAKTTANTLRYEEITELLNRKIGMLKYAVSDGAG